MHNYNVSRGPQSKTRRWCWLRDGRWLLVLAICAAGCGTSSVVKRTFVFKPKPNANGGRPFYALLRTVSEKDFFTDTYPGIAKLVYPNSDDASVLKVILVWPDRENRHVIEVPKDKAVGLYCLFTNPSNQWKVLIDSTADSEYRAVVDSGSVAGEQTGEDD